MEWQEMMKSKLIMMKMFETLKRLGCGGYYIDGRSQPLISFINEYSYLK